MEKKTRIMLTIIILCNTFIVVQSLKLLTYKVNITYVNHKHLEYLNASVIRYGRRSDYYINSKGKKYYTWDNNVTYNLIFYEYLHNEYRRSFVEMHVKLCDLINHDIFIGDVFRRRHQKCPVVEKYMELVNMTLPANFPYKFPFEQFRVDGYLDHTDTKENEVEFFNLSLPANFPYKFPFEHVHADGYIDRTGSKEVIAMQSLFGTKTITRRT